MKKILIYLGVNVVFISFFVYAWYLFSTSVFMSEVSMPIRLLLGLMNWGIIVLVIYEINKKLKQHLDKKIESND